MLMSTKYNPLDPDGDPFHPPEIATLVFCLHCRQEYDSYRIEWRVFTDADGKAHGFWCCPMPGCDGKGFGFDILPVDPEYRDERGGWFSDDDDDSEPAGDDSGTSENAEPDNASEPEDGEDEVLPW
jgi:hypothetical protein